MWSNMGPTLVLGNVYGIDTCAGAKNISLHIPPKVPRGRIVADA